MTAAGDKDFSHVDDGGLIVLYDDLLSAPRIVKVDPSPTSEFIEQLASKTYDLSHQMGGVVPYTIIREVAENFIHAAFEEVVISVLDHGNTIRFSDQGPGIAEKTKARRPGFTSATKPMKRYIRGVGSGFPIVDEFLGVTHGTLSIDDNLDHGAVITISMQKPGDESRVFTASESSQPSVETPQGIDDDADAQAETFDLSRLSERERRVIALLSADGPLGVSAISSSGAIPLSSTHVLLKKLEDQGLVQTNPAQKKRALTPQGEAVAASLEALV